MRGLVIGGGVTGKFLKDLLDDISTSKVGLLRLERGQEFRNSLEQARCGGWRKTCERLQTGEE